MWAIAWEHSTQRIFAMGVMANSIASQPLVSIIRNAMTFALWKLCCKDSAVLDPLYKIMSKLAVTVIHSHALYTTVTYPRVT